MKTVSSWGKGAQGDALSCMYTSLFFVRRVGVCFVAGVAS